MSNFRFPEGVELGGDDGDGNVTFKVSIPIDDDGFFGRECPECEQHFRIAVKDYDALPDELRLWCVYCGHNDDHGEFMGQVDAHNIRIVFGTIGAPRRNSTPPSTRTASETRSGAGSRAPDTVL